MRMTKWRNNETNCDLKKRIWIPTSSSENRTSDAEGEGAVSCWPRKLIRKIKQSDHYEVSVQNNRVPISTVSEESISSMILGASEGKFSVKTEEDPYPRKLKKKSAGLKS